MQRNQSEELLHTDGAIKETRGILSYFGHIQNYLS